MEKRILCYGDAIELLASTVYKYAKSDILREQDEPALKLRPVGTYLKDGKHGRLAVVPPLGPLVGEEMFEPSIFILTRADGKGERKNVDGDSAVRYGDAIVLVDSKSGNVWNNRCDSILQATGYLGPRPRKTRGELYLSFVSKEKSQGMNVCEGDRLSIEIVDDHRFRKSFARPLSNFKKPSSQIVGGYIVSGGEGHTITFTIRFTSSTTASASATATASASASASANIGNTTETSLPPPPLESQRSGQVQETPIRNKRVERQSLVKTTFSTSNAPALALLSAVVLYKLAQNLGIYVEICTLLALLLHAWAVWRSVEMLKSYAR